MPSRASYLVYFVYNIVLRVNLSKLSKKFVSASRKTTTNCRVSFIDLYCRISISAICNYLD